VNRFFWYNNELYCTVLQEVRKLFTAMWVLQINVKIYRKDECK